ncbi:MAG: Gfo/Idh/MocA family oxidoreductase [Cyclobacteriaceae bacterium]|nr:Gfo/Idh/MocA family oxidoreductase [Cyclobacteriaceae bacterium]
MTGFISRRDFLKKSSTGLAGITILPSLAGKVAPSDRLRIAHIGVGGMGKNHIKWFAGLPEVEIAAICDLDQSHLASGMNLVHELQPGKKIRAYGDFRRILERNDIDAITCATPDHWHAQVAILAFQSGKDVYGEKPLSYSILEGQQMLKSLEEHKRIFQLGTQIHAGDNYHRVVEIIRSGILGRIHTARLWKTGFSPGLGFPEPVKPPDTLDWDMWLGTAPEVPYVPERCHGTYRYFLDYSGGVYADFWCHIADIVFWSLQPAGLKKITARGEAPEGIADAPKWIDADFEFEDLNIFWTTNPPDVPGASGRGIGAFFEGEEGNLICDYETREISLSGQQVNDIPEIDQTLKRSPGHQQNFVDAIKSRSQPESNLPYVRKMTLPMHLGLISWRLGRPVSWDENLEKCPGDEEANQLLARKNREQWNLI